jgi:hypothetical protein
MTVRTCLIAIIMLVSASLVPAQQQDDEDFTPSVPHPAYKAGEGPRVAIDEAHHNFHTVDGRYKPFAELLRRDGYRVNGLDKPLTAATLRDIAVLVISNPLHESNMDNWSLPTPSAFTTEEIAALRAWVEDGGSLFLIADHMPFAGAAGDLARAFGVEFSNGFAAPGQHEDGKPDRFGLDTGLRASAITRGRAVDEEVTEVYSFTGSAFKPPPQASPILVFGPGSVSREPQRAWEFNSQTPTVSIEGWCQAAFMNVGRGRVALSGEAAMFTAQVAGPDRVKVGMNSPYAKQNVQLLLNLMHWLSRAPGMEKEAEQGR